MALTVLSALLRKTGVSPADIGRLDVSSECGPDASKSIKTHLMMLFEPSGNTDVEGGDNLQVRHVFGRHGSNQASRAAEQIALAGLIPYRVSSRLSSRSSCQGRIAHMLKHVFSPQACYGGTAALFNAVNWVESRSWDGRFAAVVMTDIALYPRGPARPTSGCGAVAMLVGPDAPLALERGLAATHMVHAYDFYKPHVGLYPLVSLCDLRRINECIKGCKMALCSSFNLATRGV